MRFFIRNTDLELYSTALLPISTGLLSRKIRRPSQWQGISDWLSIGSAAGVEPRQVPSNVFGNFLDFPRYLGFYAEFAS